MLLRLIAREKKAFSPTASICRFSRIPRSGQSPRYCHQAAKQIWQRLTDERWTTFTSNFVVAESHALFLARLGHDAAVAFLQQMEQSATTIVRVSRADEDQGRQLIYRYHDKDFSLTDALSFVVMERLRIHHAFSFDRHFTQYGFTVLTAEQV